MKVNEFLLIINNIISYKCESVGFIFHFGKYICTLDHIMNELMFSETQSPPIGNINTVNDLTMFAAAASCLTVHGMGNVVNFIKAYFGYQFRNQDVH